MSIRAGRLNRKVDIYRQVIVTDDYGDSASTTLELRGSAWASVRASTGTEKMQFGREESATIMYSLEIRFNKDIEVTDQILFNGYYMNIVSIAPRGRLNRETVEVYCEVLEVSKLVK